MLPTNQELRPAGLHVEFGGRPNAVAIRPDGRTAALLTDQAPAVTVVDVASGAVIQRYDPKLGDAAFAGLAYYTQIDLLRTIEQILGLPPMYQVDLMAQPMRSLFTDTPDRTPFTAVVPDVERLRNPPLAGLTGLARQWAAACLRIDFTHPDAAPEQLLNRAIWYALKGFTPYPGDTRVLTPDEVLALPDTD